MLCSRNMRKHGEIFMFLAIYRQSDGSYNNSFDTTRDAQTKSVVEFADKGARTILNGIIAEEDIDNLCNLRAKTNVSGIYVPKEFIAFFSLK